MKSGSLQYQQYWQWKDVVMVLKKFLAFMFQDLIKIIWSLACFKVRQIQFQLNYKTYTTSTHVII